jgi:hypothetical protein
LKKILYPIFGIAIVAGTVASARSQSLFPNRAWENYDIRDDRQPEGVNAFAEYQKAARPRDGEARMAAAQILARGRMEASTRIQGLHVEDNRFGTAPEIVQVTGATAALTPRSTEARERIARGFIVENAALYGLTAAQARQLQVVADYINPAGNLAWVEYEQRINGIPVFQGYWRAGLTNDGRIWRTTSNLAAGLDYSRLPSAAKLTPSGGAMAAAKAIGVKVDESRLRPVSDDRENHVTRLAQGPFTEEIKVELVYFAGEPGLATLAYSMVLWEPHDAYWVLVDANDGRLLWRKNITNEQTQSVTYSVYNDDSPAPLSPTNAVPGSGIQGAPISRTTITNISELPAFDNLGWITDGAGNAVTTGNNVDAGLDIDGTNGIDPAGRATATGRVFNFPYAPGGTPGEEPPTGTNYRMGTVTNLFFWSNRYHDRLYQLGFTEQARNFQNDNFGRGGLAVDFVRAEAQDSSGVNSANFSTPGDGSQPRMQMFIFDAPTPDRDTSIDANVFLHELTHGTSNRLHSNGSGLSTTMSGGMGEGWSDFYAFSLLSSADEDVNALYAMGAYVTLNFTRPGVGTTGTDNYYYGIRRFPYAVKTNVGGPTALRPGQPHNPLTFADMDVALNSINDGAYNPSPSVIITPNEAHRIGEIWCLMLWEMRARIITRMGWTTGNQHVLQLVTDAMKLDPAGPTALQARDSLLAATCAGANGADPQGSAGSDEQDIWAGFATRGAGLSARATGGTTLVTDIIEAFDVPNLNLNAVTFTDTGGNANGFADPGETIALTVPLANPFCSTPASTTMATVSGGGTGNYGTIAAGAAVSQIISYTVPAGTPCGTLLNIPVNISSSLGPVTRSFTLLVGQPAFSLSQTFDSVTVPALPAGWTTAHTGALADWVTSATNPSSSPNDVFSNEAPSAATSELVTPDIPINSGNAQLTFRNLFNLQASAASAFDGMVLEISIPSVAGGAFQDILAAGGSFPSGGNGYNLTISAAPNPLNGRQCWSGLSGGTTAAPAYITSTVNLPAAANGQSIKLKWRRGDDSSAVAPGLAGARIDDIKVATSFSCSPFGPTPTPGLTPTPTPTPTPGITPTPAPTATATPFPTPNPPTPTVTVTPPVSPTPTPTPTPTTAQALNISTRLRVETGNNVVIGGFIISGNDTKNVAVRGIGPSLTAFGISDALADPTLELRAANGLLMSLNDNWQDDSLQAAQLTALGLAPTNVKESALVVSLQPAAYTAILSGKNQGTGVGLMEIYDTNGAAAAQLANISTRGFVRTGENVMIGGFILGGNSGTTRVVVRGIGPSLAQFGLNPVLVDPTLELRDSNGGILVANDNWQDDAVSAAQLNAAGFALSDPKESGIFTSLPPGQFTAILAGKDGGIGIGLIEIYNLR